MDNNKIPQTPWRSFPADVTFSMPSQNVGSSADQQKQCSSQPSRTPPPDRSDIPNSGSK